MQFEDEARRDQVWLRAFFMGPTGSGKSRGALELATKLSAIYDGIPVTLINTEKGRGKLYADRFKFSYIGLEDEESLGPETWIHAFDLAEQQNPGGIVVADSVSHEWMGRDGVLQRADKFGEWKTVRPQHNSFVDRLLQVEGHVIVCCRAKMKYGVTEEEVPGRSKPRQVVTMLGVGPIQSDDLQYEFNLVGRFDVETHEVQFSGHVDPLVDTIHNLLEADSVAATLAKWLSDGDPIEPPAAADPKDVEALIESLTLEGFAFDVIEEKFAIARRTNRGQLHPDYVTENLAKSKDRVARKQRKDEKREEAEQAQASLDEHQAEAALAP